MTAKVSVCIPVYGVEKYIEQCARSLFEQTMQDGIEFIFVNDCTKDKSVEILEKVLSEYPQRREQVKIIHHEKNGGLVAARNTALKYVTGEYVIHCDSDDWVELDMYEKMYNKAKETDADMVYCSYVREFEKSKNLLIKAVGCDTPHDMLNRMYSKGVQRPLWNKLYKREIALHKSIKCPDDITMCEDLLRNTFMLSLCEKIIAVHDCFYHYRFTKGSITNSSDRMILLKNLEMSKKVISVVEEKGLVMECALNCDKIYVLRRALFIGVDKEYYQNIFPDLQANLKNTKMRFDIKLPLMIACYNMPIGRALDIVLVRIKKIIMKLLKS